jgi:outer membrane receptor protein involved in Fe transport
LHSELAWRAGHRSSCQKNIQGFQNNEEWNVKRRSWIRGSIIVSCSIIIANHSAHAQSAQSATSEATPPTGGLGTGDLDEIVVNGIRRGDLILPTTVTSTSAYGLDLGVMDTPRNNTLLSKAQLDALNVQNPGGFSYLTSSSYSDASFGQPNVPRIRGQYADMFFNGMRDSFTLNGYGAPISFNSVDAIDIVKGPASVQGGPGAGVGGSIDIVTKMPSLTKFSADANLEFDTQQKRRGSIDLSGPIAPNWGGRLSFTDDGSGSYYNDMFFHQQSVFVALLGQVTPKYSLLITGGLENTTYREDDGINRVNQQLIDNNTYLTGGVVGGPAGVSGFGSSIDLTGTTQLPPRVIINEPIGDSAHSLHIKGQIIQTFNASDNFSIVNNTFYDYMNRYNEVQDYYADTAKGSFTIENKTDFKVKFDSGPVNHEVDAGFTYRYAHVLDIQNFLNEPVSIYDLSGDPNTFTFPASLQIPSGTFLYNGAFNHPQYGLPGRFQGPPGEFTVTGFLNGTVDSNLRDAAVFLEHRLKFSPQWSVLYGLRGDLVQLNYSDPLGGPDYGAPPGLSPLPQSASTAWYGLYNGNISVVYSPTSQLSLYLTFNKAQYVLPTANDGAVATWGEAPTDQLRQNTLLEEGGIKLDLFDKRLFISTAGFYQERAQPTGSGNLHTVAHSTGAEFELNYQPDPHFFATASYSYLHTTLDTAATFYNFPAQPGINYDGAGISATNPFLPNQTFQDPGVPQQLFNVLANYKHESGWGAQANIQVTSPIAVSQSGFIDVAAESAGFPGLPPALAASLLANGGYYKAPVIHWQYTANAAGFYSFRNYQVKLSIYNLANRRNFTNDIPFYGDDFLTRQPPRDYDLTISAKF